MKRPGAIVKTNAKVSHGARPHVPRPGEPNWLSDAIAIFDAGLRKRFRNTEHLFAGGVGPKRKQLAEQLTKIRELIQVEFDLPATTIAEARAQLGHVAKTATKAINAMRAARDALMLKQEWADGESLAAWSAAAGLGQTAWTSLTQRSDSDEWGDPDAPLGPVGYDQILARWEADEKLLAAATDFALRQREFWSRKSEGRKPDEWKRNLVFDVASLFEQFSLENLIKKTKEGPLHTVTNIIAGSFPGEANCVADTAFFSAVVVWKIGAKSPQSDL